MSAPLPRAYDAAVVVIPAHNEAATLPSCLRAVLTASLCVPMPVSTVVVLDATDDGSPQLAGEYGPDVHFLSIDARNAGAARAVGFGYARSLVGRAGECWYATTDADGRVDPGWLVRQLRSGADMVCGQSDRVRGVDMGFSSRAYWRVGGFRTLAAGEDADLAARFEAAGYRIDRDNHRDIGRDIERDTDFFIASARIRARAPHGFAHHLGHPRRSAAGDCA